MNEDKVVGTALGIVGVGSFLLPILVFFWLLFGTEAPWWAAFLISMGVGGVSQYLMMSVVFMLDQFYLTFCAWRTPWSYRRTAAIGTLVWLVVMTGAAWSLLLVWNAEWGWLWRAVAIDIIVAASSVLLFMIEAVTDGD